MVVQWAAVVVGGFIQECEAVAYYAAFHHAAWDSIIAVDLHEVVAADHLPGVDLQCITIKVPITKVHMDNR